MRAAQVQMLLQVTSFASHALHVTFPSAFNKVSNARGLCKLAVEHQGTKHDHQRGYVTCLTFWVSSFNLRRPNAVAAPFKCLPSSNSLLVIPNLPSCTSSGSTRVADATAFDELLS
jgi:hypothetical protein